MAATTAATTTGDVSESSLVPIDSTVTTTGMTQPQMMGNSSMLMNQTGMSPYSSMYSSPGYGGYGGYGSSYGMYNSGFGGGFGGYGMNGMGGMYPMGGYGGYGMMNQSMPIAFMQNSVNNVGRVAQFLQIGSQTMHMAFSSFVQFLQNLTQFSAEYGTAFSIFSIYQIWRKLWTTLKRLWYRVRGQEVPTNMEDLFQKAQEPNQSGADQMSWVGIGFCICGLILLYRWVKGAIEAGKQQQIQMKKAQLARQQQMASGVHQLPSSNAQMNVNPQMNPLNSAQTFSTTYPQQQRALTFPSAETGNVTTLTG